jgi:uncharacterized protein YwgA
MKPEVLAGLLKRSYEKIDLEKFEDRLKIQKYIYILQNRGIPLGFYFNFYLYGPYSTDLTRTSYQIQNYEKMKRVKFKDASYEEKFKDILNVINTHSNDTKWLECASSILFLKEMGYEKKTIFERIKKKITTFEDEYVDQVWNELNEIGWINE